MGAKMKSVDVTKPWEFFKWFIDEYFNVAASYFLVYFNLELIFLLMYYLTTNAMQQSLCFVKYIFVSYR